MDRRPLTRLRIAFLLLGAALLLPLGWLLRSVDARLEAQRRLRHELVAERIFDEMEGELTALLAREDARPSAAYGDTSTRVENWAPFVVGYFTRDARGVQIVAKPQLAAERVSRLEATLKRAAVRGGGEHAGSAAPASRALGTTQARLAEAESAAAKAAEARRAAAQAAATSRNVPLAARQAMELDEPLPDAGEPKRKADNYGTMERKSAAKGIGAAPAAEPASSPAQAVQAAPEAVLKQLNRAADSRKREAPSSKSKAKLSRDDSDPLSGLE